MAIRVNGQKYVPWRAEDSEGYELDMRCFIEKQRNKNVAIHFFKRLLCSHPLPRVIVTNQPHSYCISIKNLLHYVLSYLAKTLAPESDVIVDSTGRIVLWKIGMAPRKA